MLVSTSLTYRFTGVMVLFTNAIKPMLLAARYSAISGDGLRGVSPCSKSNA
jgi:hypothetical protein